MVAVFLTRVLMFLRVFLFLFTFNFLYLGFSAQASQLNAAWLSSKVLQSVFLDITVVANHRLIAVGERGHILYSNDGEQWQQVASPVDSTLTHVFFIDEDNGWIVGHDAVILHSSDGGKSWHIQQYLPELERPLFDITFKDPNNGIAIGAYGLFYRTINGGKHWQQEFHEEFLNVEDQEYLVQLKIEDEAAYLDERSAILPHFNHVEQNGRTLYLVGEMGLVAKSNDFGKKWQVITPFYHGSFFDLIRNKQGGLLVSGLRGHLFYSDNNADSWRPINTKSTSLLNAIVRGEGEIVYLLANGGSLFKSDDGGKTVNRLNLQFPGSLVDGVWFNRQLIITSDKGIYRIVNTKTTKYKYKLAYSSLISENTNQEIK